MEFRIVMLRDHPELSGKAAMWFHRKWGIPLEAYEGSIAACLSGKGVIPQWYVALDEQERIVGGLGVIENDFHLRRDLTPNGCAVYVEATWRGKGIARALLNYVCRDLAAMGIHDFYLLTDHTQFYERCGWEYLCEVEEEGGSTARMYHRHI